LGQLAQMLASYDLGYFDDEMCRLEPIANPTPEAIGRSH
jgi:hypothetical protein